MRTTIELPDDLLKLVRSIARETHRSVSETVADFIRRCLEANAVPQKEESQISRSKLTGFPTIHVGRVVTTEEVRSLEDDELEMLEEFASGKRATNYPS